jgi:glutamate racemase
MGDSRSIGIFDSGFGGLTVMRAIRAALPEENIIYFGDTARLPYGTKSGETILRYSLENAAFLMSFDIKVLVIACHTACCYALETLEQQLSIPVVGMISPSVEKILHISSQGKIGILGTRATITSGTYQKHIMCRNPQAQITAIPCPLFVQLVEEGFLDHPLTQMAIQEYLRPLQNQKVDTLLLGSTHFPLLAPYIQHEVGTHVNLIDPGIACAEALKTVLQEKNLIHTSSTPPQYQFFVSDDPDKFRLLGKSFLNYPIESVAIKNT